jgi:hypothetical protein
MICSGARPISSARRADSSADTMIARYMICCGGCGSDERAFSSISSVRSSWSRLPQLTPIRTALSWRAGRLDHLRELAIVLVALADVAGLMRYFESASAQAGKSVSRRWPL